MFFIASTKIGVASLTASSAARLITFKPSSASLLVPILRSVYLLFVTLLAKVF
jgi:hypothetical protein